MRTVTASCIVLLILTGAAKAADPHLAVDIPYADARDVLLQRGYRPFVMPGSESCEQDNPRCYPELEQCVHKRRWICTYAWRYEASIFHVETKSDVPVLDLFYCFVNCTAAGGAIARSAFPNPPSTGTAEAVK